jgi:hypothetical protein
MPSDLEWPLLLAATIVNGLLAGAGLDKALVQLPARRKIGLHAMAEYNRATDLSSGLFLCPTLDLGPLLTVAATLAIHLSQDASGVGTFWIILAAVLSVGHGITTARAAPNLLRLRHAIPADGALDALYQRFANWSGVRTVLQVSTFIVVVVALTVLHRLPRERTRVQVSHEAEGAELLREIGVRHVVEAVLGERLLLRLLVDL